MGTQWPQMGRSMMSIDAFHGSIKRSDATLAVHGVKLYDLIMKGGNDAFESTLNSFIGIAAIQVIFLS